MKYVISCLILGTMSVQAYAEDKMIADDTIALEETQDMSFMRNYDAKIKNLENYTVTYVEPGQKKVIKVASQANDGVHVRLIPTKKKS